MPKRKDGRASFHRGTKRPSEKDPRRSGDSDEQLVPLDKKPKKKVTCLVGYCGTGYSGLQLNPGMNTIENAFFQAFIKAGAIGSYNADDPSKVSFSRAARTDKGVHAAVNAITLKLIDLGDDAVEQINTHLPETLRLWKIVRTLGSFDPRTFCDSRIYEYLIPSHCFLPPNPASVLAKGLAKSSKDRASLSEAERAQKELYHKDQEAFWSKMESNVSAELEKEGPHGADSEQDNVHGKSRMKTEAEMKNAYRISPERLEIIRQAFRQFEGTNNFHNFTNGKGFRDPSAKRYIIKFEVSEPRLIHDTEWLSLKVHGQSFMLHQIRKMISLAMLCVRCATPLERIRECFGPDDLNIPKSPGLGLLLERPVFDGYKKRASEFGREGIETEHPDFEQDVESFKMKHIYQRIFEEGSKELTFHGFCEFIDNQLTEVLQYLTDEGIKPKSEFSWQSYKALESANDRAPVSGTGELVTNKHGSENMSDDV